MINHIFSLRALSPLHCGVGQGLNDIDMPTARNNVTGHPIVPGSSLKGVLKDEFIKENYGKATENQEHQKMVDALFGRDGNDNASAISLGDANLLALPVRSYYGTFAYMASPYTLQQLKNHLVRIGKTNLPELPVIGLDKVKKYYKALITGDSLLKTPDLDIILLEELDLLIDNANQQLAHKWADLIAPMFFEDAEGRDIFKKRFVITDDNALNFLCETALPVDARISIDQKTGTTKQGALWYEETVPAETLFFGIAGVDRSYNKEVKKTDKELSRFLIGSGRIYCQIGGKATTGKGFVAIDFGKSGEDQ